MNELLRRESPLWLVTSSILLLLVIGGVVVEGGPTAAVAVLLIVVAVISRSENQDVARLVIASLVLFVLGIAASVVPTAEGCGVPIIESAQHQTVPTPHIHGPCEQGMTDALWLG